VSSRSSSTAASATSAARGEGGIPAHQADALLATDLARLACSSEAACQLADLIQRHGWRLLIVHGDAAPARR